MIQGFLAFLKTKKEKAQSFVELALVLPIILLILLGLVEVSFFISRYLDVMDLTREAARFASIRDPEIGTALDQPICMTVRMPLPLIFTTIPPAFFLHQTVLRNALQLPVFAMD